MIERWQEILPNSVGLGGGAAGANEIRLAFIEGSLPSSSLSVELQLLIHLIICAAANNQCEPVPYRLMSKQVSWRELDVIKL